VSTRDIDTVSFSLEVNIEKAYEDIRRVQTLLFRILNIVQRMSGDEKLDAFISKLQRLIMILNQARLTIIAFQIASGPIGWGLAIVGLAGTALTIAEEMDSFLPTY